MSSDLTTTGQPDQRRIPPDQIEAWATSLGTTPRELIATIASVGNRVADVRSHLALHWRPAGYGRSGQGAASVIPHMEKQAQSNVFPPPPPEPPPKSSAN